MPGRSRRLFSVPVPAVLAILLPVMVGAAAAAPPNADRTPSGADDLKSLDTGEIELVESWDKDGWRLDLYRNHRRSCSQSGYHTFLVSSRPGLATTQEAPLWMRFHGGGVGWFLPDGEFATGKMTNIQEERRQLTVLLEETGLMKMIGGHPASFRLMMPSGCDNDLYSGIGAVDHLNQYPSEDGRPRLVDGLLAVREALAYTRANYSTTHIFAQGTSAGGIGVTTLALALGAENRRLSGVIPDTGTTSEHFPALGDHGCTEFGDLDLRGAFERIGHYALPENMPDQLVSAGQVSTPIFEVWSRNEHSVCGEEVYTIPTRDGGTITGQGQWIMHHAFAAALEKNNPGGASVSHKVCVDRPANISKNPEFKECALHGITKFSISIVGGDRDRDGEDFNRLIYDWVLARLEEPIPE